MKQALTRPNGQTLLRPLLIGLGGVAALTASSWIAVPMYPVPMTMQTLVVLMLLSKGSLTLCIPLEPRGRESLRSSGWVYCA